MSDQKPRFKEICAYFLKMGLLGFGGPLAVMAAYQKDLVEDRRWISREDFARAVALIKALPGPAATQLSIYMGQVRGGKLGGLLAGLCLILPSFIMMLLLGAFYASVEALSWSKPLLFGMQAAALGVITESVWRLSKPYKTRWIFWAVAAAAIGLTSWRQSVEPLVIIGAGLIGVATLRLREGGALALFTPAFAAPMSTGAAIASGTHGTAALPALLGVCFKSGAFVFGTGLAIVPLLVHDVVNVHHWLTHQQFMDALAFGQITPGPVVITATFIGFKVAGLLGAVVATIGIFTPAFFNILTWFPWAERKLGGSPYTKEFVMWAVAAVCGSILVTVVRLGASPLEGGTHLTMVLIGGAALAASLFTQIPVWVVIPAGGVITALIAAF